MENSEYQGSAKQDSPEVLPSLIKYISANEVAGFDSIEDYSNLNKQYQKTGIQPFISSAKGFETAAVQSQGDESQSISSERMHSVSISMPSSPMEVHLQSTNSAAIFSNGISDSSATAKTVGTRQRQQAKFRSQPMPMGSAYVEAVTNGNFPNHIEQQLRNPRIDGMKDKRYDSFKTWSGRLERQFSQLRGKQRENEPKDNVAQNAEIETLPVDRYFDALEGPELDTLRASEELVLPEDKKWPFLLRLPISSFGICLAIVSFIYSLKVILYFEAVRREYFHPIRINFFFAPWISFLFLVIGLPPSVATNPHAALWYILMAPIICLELKIYGQWMSGGQRRLSKVANPSNHLSIVGNFVGALLGASMGLKEGPIFFFAIGLAHYTVLFVTLYQRLPTNETLPKELHPVFFLFVAAPSVASMAWERIHGSFDYGSRIAYFIALFLYFSLAVRVNFFRGFRFSLAWWAYTFPMTGASIATIKYSNEVTNIGTQALSIVLCSIATLTVIALLLTTILHGFVLQDLFPNDIAIAISERRPKTNRKWLEHLLKFVSSDGKDIEASLKSPSSTAEGIEASSPTNVLNSRAQCVQHPKEVLPIP
ncbi:hypothetical protein L1049_020362 [Liquidambar formosana]|uniref:S-type anion channel SLAH2-like n=1 Tax=Liquidambar formosana TaxID=63359 RepID=A0AAP0S7G0_LIQFO